MFWPRGSWIKYPGKAVFEILPHVNQTLDAAETLKYLQMRLEEESGKLMKEAAEIYKTPVRMGK
jgi:hypothetical protein